LPCCQPCGRTGMTYTAASSMPALMASRRAGGS
jgi:hypothetical protein